MLGNVADLGRIVSSYVKSQELYADHALTVANIIKSILAKEGIPYQSVAHRGKTVESLREKIRRKRVQGVIYLALEDITDLAGVRVILYFKDDVERVLEIIESRFSSIMKKMEPPKPQLQHGYAAVHRIVTLREDRTNLDEYSRYTNLFAEVQIKTVLQHAWAEIEHDIGYKPKVTEMDLEREEIRTLFVDNARLLEEVDNKFVKIRSLHEGMLSKYQSSITQEDLEIPVNYDTVATFLKNRYKGKYIRKQDIIDILVQTEQRNLGNLKQLSDALDEKTIAFSYQD